METATADHSGHSNPVLKWAALFILSLGLAIIIIDSTLLNVSLGTIIHDLNTNIQSIQWVITVYSLILASLTIAGGRIGDLFGRRKMFMVGAAIFAVGSFIASISHSVGILLVGESIVEGIGAALMMPATASLLVANYRGRDRAIAFGVWGGVAGAASAVGPIVGGFLTSNYSWRWGFLINVFVAAVLIIGSLLLIKESLDTAEKKQIDFVGIILSAVGLLLIVFGIIQAPTYGWLAPKQHLIINTTDVTIFGLSPVPFAIALGFFALFGFYLWEKRRESQDKTPLVSLELFKNKTFTLGVMTTAIISLGLVGSLFSLPVFLQSVLHLDAFHTGVALLPLSVTMLIMAPLSGFLSSKFPLKYLIVGGIFIDAIGMFFIRMGIGPDAAHTNLTPGLIMMGFGMGMAMAQIGNLTLSAVSVQQAGEASGVSNTVRQIGSALGSAIIGAVLLSVLSVNIVSGIKGSTVIPNAYKNQIEKAVSNNSANVEFGGGAAVAKNVPQVIIDEITKISKTATVEATRSAFVVAVIFVIMAFISALFLPNKRQEDKSAAHSPSGGH